jgi:hypothetical protein
VYIDPKQQYLSAVLTTESSNKIKELVGPYCKIKGGLHCTLAYSPDDINNSPYKKCIGQTMSFTTGELVDISNQEGQINTVITYSDGNVYHITLVTSGKYKPVDAKFAMLRALGNEKYVFKNFTTKSLPLIEFQTVITAVNRR